MRHLAVAIFATLATLGASQLLSVIVIHRHGDRNPLRSYRNDPYRVEAHWPEGYGQLSQGGIRRQYALGVWLRSRYSHLLPARYSPRTLRALSTDVDRTLMSAQVTWAGLLPPPPTDNWSGEIRWQPVPVHTTPQHQDPLLAMKKPCRKHSKLLEDVLKSPIFTEMNELNRDLFDLLSQGSGENISSIYGVERIHNTLHSQRLRGKRLPDWTAGVFPDRMRFAAILLFRLPCSSVEMTRLEAGLLFGEVLRLFGGFTGNGMREGPRFVTFSGHDSTLATVLLVLGMFDDVIPEYSSAVIMELHRNDSGGHYVNLFFKNSTGLHGLVLNNCTFDCDFKKFAKFLEPIVISNATQWEKECEN